MKYTLTDYQEKAVADVFNRFGRAAAVRQAADLNAVFALTAPTGAGKTVIATAVIEALLDGSTDFGVDPDENAVVLWLTNDPALNTQTRRRMIQASDTLTSNRLIAVGDDAEGGSRIDQEKFSRGHVYFLNVQKFYKSSTKWVLSRTNGREYGIWDTLANTINDASLNVYLIIDEAHRGIGKTNGSAADKQTTLRKIITGDGEHPAPVVWGISATPENFNTAVAGMEDTHQSLPPVKVDIERVRQSGLLKDTIILDSPGEAGEFDTTLLREAVRATVAYETEWAAYAQAEAEPPVLPVLVVQVPSDPSEASLTEIVQVLLDEWDGLKAENIVNVFGEHTDLALGGHTVTYRRPEDIQDDNDVRVVLGKDAITTGWDCPRAEVLFSLRKSKDYTTIAQMIGRIVRTPLARRVIADGRLNTVACFLPRYNRTAVEEVIARFRKGADDEPPIDIIDRTEKVDVMRNPDVPQAVFDLIESLPSESIPKSIATNQVVRLRRLAQELAKIDPDANLPGEVTRLINGVLDGQRAEKRDAYEAMKTDIATADIHRVEYQVVVEHGHKDAGVANTRTSQVDQNNLDDAYKKAVRTIPEGAVSDYERYLQARLGDPTSPDFDEDYDFTESKLEAAAIALLPGVAEAVEARCEQVAQEWYARYRTRIRSRESVHSEIQKIMSGNRAPERSDITLPDKDKVTVHPESFKKHVLVTDDGTFPIKVNGWEREVIKAEAQHSYCWYRNPSSATEAALRIPYDEAGTLRDEGVTKDKKWKSLQPDFVFIHEGDNGTFVPSVVDPHGSWINDALPKLKALAEYAQRCLDSETGNPFARIDAIAENAHKELVTLDMTEEHVRAAVLAYTGTQAKDLYNDTAITTKYQLASDR